MRNNLNSQIKKRELKKIKNIKFRKRILILRPNKLRIIIQTIIFMKLMIKSTLKKILFSMNINKRGKNLFKVAIKYRMSYKNRK